jgi:hypothetical protein
MSARDYLTRDVKPAERQAASIGKPAAVIKPAPAPVTKPAAPASGKSKG